MFDLYEAEEYTIVAFGDKNEINAGDSNMDVEVRFKDGRRHGATFFTINNISSLFEKNKLTGECGGGLYLWSSNMILVERLTSAVVIGTIKVLIAEKEFQSAFEFFEPEQELSDI